jgi:hypothetical protein
MEFIRLIKKLLLFLPVLLVMIGFNYFVDPANIFKGSEYYQNIAKLLLSGKNIANLVNFDERLLKKYYLDGMTEKKDVIVLGSSRVMLINSDMFKGYSFYNNGVSSASLEDDMAIYWTYRKKGLIPRVAIIGLDPWLLNKFNGNQAFQPINKEYEEISAHLGISNGQPQASGIFSSKYFELVSPKYFQSAVRFWLLHLKENKKDSGDYYPTTDTVADDIIRRADGSISYNTKYRNTDPAEVRSLAVAFANDNPSMLNHFIRLDPALMDEFDKFINLLTEDKVKVVFYLPPYHPAAYGILVKSPNYAIIKDVQDFFENYAKDKNITLIGSYDPSDYNLQESDFYDAMHQNVQSINKMFSEANVGI